MIKINTSNLFDKSNGNSVTELASTLFHSQVASHIMHLQTKSFAQHMALGGYYETITGLIDRLIEGAQGYQGMILSGYAVPQVGDTSNPLEYFKNLLVKVKPLRDNLPHPFLEQVADDIIELISSTIYKLEQLS